MTENGTDERLYTESHEWIVVEGDIGTVGVSDHAQKELGDIVYVELPEIDAEVNAGDEIAVLESTKAAADVYSPVTGVVVAVNETLAEAPEQVNRSPQTDGWLFKVRLSDPAELEELMNGGDYQSMIG